MLKNKNLQAFEMYVRVRAYEKRVSGNQHLVRLENVASHCTEMFPLAEQMCSF